MNFLEKLTQKQKDELHLNILREQDVLAVRRSQAIILLEENASVATIKSITGYKRAVAVKIRKLYVKKGVEGIRSKRKKKYKALLTKNQKKQIIKMLNTQTPKDFGYSSENFWNTTMLGVVIKEKFGVEYKSKTSLYLIFKEAKFSFHKPKKISERRNEEQISQWKEQYGPIIKEELAKEETVFLTGDEAVLTSQTRLQRAWLPINAPAYVEDTVKRKIIHFYGFLNIKSGKVFLAKTQNQTGETTVSILKKLAKYYQDKKIVIFWDNASWHKSAFVRAYLETTNQFKLYNFPPYAPDLNPQEHVWKEMREKVLSNKLISDIHKAANDAIKYINNCIFKYKFFGAHGTFNL